MLPRITQVQHLGGFRLKLTFSDQTQGEIDLADSIVGKGGVFAPLEDVAYFSRVKTEPEFGTIVWPNGLDFCPDVLYSKATGKPIPFAQPDSEQDPRHRKSA